MSTRFRAALAALLVTLGLLGGAGSAAADALPRCDRGELCLWPGPDYRGDPVRLSLADTNPGECVPLPGAIEVRSFANLLSRPVTVYQGRECSTEGEFDTYPGEGTYVPWAPFVVRGVQIWSS